MQYAFAFFVSPLVKPSQHITIGIFLAVIVFEILTFFLSKMTHLKNECRRIQDVWSAGGPGVATESSDPLVTELPFQPLRHPDGSVRHGAVPLQPVAPAGGHPRTTRLDDGLR